MKVGPEHQLPKATIILLSMWTKRRRFVGLSDLNFAHLSWLGNFVLHQILQVRLSHFAAGTAAAEP